MIQYKTLANQLMAEIDSGSMVAGQRLLSVRDFSRQQQVSMTTALNCYNFLVERGYASTRPRAGYFAQKPVLNLRTIPLQQFSPEPQVAAQPPLIHSQHPLATAQMAESLLPLQQLGNAARSVFKRAHAQGLHYGDSNGHPFLHRALAAHYAEAGFTLNAGNIVIGNGCLDSVRLALEVTTQPEDVVVVASPCFNGLLDILRSMNRRILEIPSTRQGIDLVYLEDIIRSGSAAALLLTANFQNPLGHQFSNAHKAAIAELANRYQFPVIEDDVYQELSFNGVLPLPIKHWDTDGNVLWCSSFSKTLCASYRLGWCEPGRFYPLFAARRRAESMGVNMPLQAILADFIASGNYRKHIRKLLPLLSQQVRDYRHYLLTNTRDDLAVSEPQGGMVLWCQVPRLNSEQLAADLDTEQVAIRPGNLFSSRHYYHDYFRINCGWPLDDERKRELDILLQKIERNRTGEVETA
ncbi:aminotransferase-like domain-containing protein [Planctobacterium marinum]|uniref:aminotransferase-like domain-containing protein n=1 Tax=Planctobacterium marinum TaxID=1631968 RepID=UPI001E592D3E|nr:PLP-dependent aminotransferase family protein [Planctobacterium marinum]MCC2608132.1 PLP-dependent aminotransferase family protein [Planctobacterium marinum]